MKLHLKEDYKGEEFLTIKNGVLVKCDRDAAGEIEIPDGVKEISSEAFCECWKITSVIIPDSVTNIGNAVFAQCDNLISVKIGNGVTNIGYSGFLYCKNLKSIEIPNNVTSIGYSAFLHCKELTSAIISGDIGNSAFCECFKLNSVTLLDNVRIISHNAFANCSNLESIIIPDSVNKLGKNVFTNCDNLKSITMSETLMHEYGFNLDVPFDCLVNGIKYSEILELIKNKKNQEPKLKLKTPVNSLKDDDSEDWEDIANYSIAYEEDDSVYEDGAYFTITYSPSANKYCWTSSIEFEAEDVFDTYDKAYEDAVNAHRSYDGSELVVDRL